MSKVQCSECNGDGRTFKDGVIVTCPVCRGQGEYYK